MIGKKGFRRTISFAFIIIIFASVAYNSDLGSAKRITENQESQEIVQLSKLGDQRTHHREKRFIMAFQVTKPPGMFQMTLRRPYFFQMMSNLTRSMFSSSFADMLRGFAGNFATANTNATIVDAIQSRQEDLEIPFRK